jgi:uncharacterized damage-inducible protein DinB
MNGRSNFELMAQYNLWMNEKLFKAASSLSDAVVREDQGAFFKSILGTLNHLLVTDIIWLKRFAGHPRKYEALQFLHEVPNPGSLDQILHNDLSSLWKERTKLDDAIVRWQGEVETEDLAVDLEYANSKGKRFANNFNNLIQHYFNHQTHHRGQITTLLSQRGIDVGSTDLLMLIRE